MQILIKKLLYIPKNFLFIIFFSVNFFLFLGCEKESKNKSLPTPLVLVEVAKPWASDASNTSINDTSLRHPSPFPSLDHFESNSAYGNKGIVSGERPFVQSHSHSRPLGHSRLPHRAITVADYSNNRAIVATLIEAIYHSTYIHVDKINRGIDTNIDAEDEDEVISKAVESSS